VFLEHRNRELKTLLQICTRVRVIESDPGQFLPTSVQKIYFLMRSGSTCADLDNALRKYRHGPSDLIPVGGIAQLKLALSLVTSYRLMIRDVVGYEVFTSYTRWLECLQLKEGPQQEVLVAFSPKRGHRFSDESIRTMTTPYSRARGRKSDDGQH
jgi:hypothetical protein